MADLVGEVGSGDLRRSLTALRDRLAAEIEEGARCKECHGSISSPTAPLGKLLADVLVRLAALPQPKGSAVDELKRKRGERRAGVAVAPAKGRKRGAGGGGARS